MVRIHEDDVSLFCRASYDRNPLHTSEEYSRGTAFGRPLVYGVLGGLASLSELPPQPNRRLTRIILEFRGPVFTDIDYNIDDSLSTDKESSIKLLDGTRVSISAAVQFGESRHPVALKTGGEASLSTVRGEASEPNLEHLSPGVQVNTIYSPSWPDVARLVDRFGLRHKGISEAEVAALLALSYLVGMELPGRRGLFSRLDLDLSNWTDIDTAFHLRARILTYDKRVSLLTTEVSLDGRNGASATARLRSFIRQDVKPMSISTLRRLLPVIPMLEDRVALIIGGSRGLGAALARSLMIQGCTVLVSYSRSREAAESLVTPGFETAGSIHLLQGDGSDRSWCEEALDRIASNYGGLDILICNAAPPPLPLTIHASTAERMNTYIRDSVELACTPMTVFLDTLSSRSGWNVVVSSDFVSNPSLEWPHYVSAKSAIEGFTRVAALSFPTVTFLIARPPPLRTDLRNTPLGLQGTIPPEHVAAHIVNRLVAPRSPGSMEILQEFTISNDESTHRQR